LCSTYWIIANYDAFVRKTLPNNTHSFLQCSQTSNARIYKIQKSFFAYILQQFIFKHEFVQCTTYCRFREVPDNSYFEWTVDVESRSFPWCFCSPVQHFPSWSTTRRNSHRNIALKREYGGPIHSLTGNNKKIQKYKGTVSGRKNEKIIQCAFRIFWWNEDFQVLLLYISVAEYCSVETRVVT
jgi:hypothetical protein